MENNIIISIIVGVVSGILTSVLLWSIIKLFNNTVIPWYQSLIYKGQDISGEWEGFYNNEQKMETCSFINIKQRGTFITGSFILVKQPGGGKCNKKYNFTGTLYNTNLVISYDITDKTRVGCGSCVFCLEDDGQKLNGFLTGINALSHGVITTSLYWIRKI